MPETAKDVNPAYLQTQMNAFMPRDPLSMLLMAPLLPLIFLMQSLSMLMMQPTMAGYAPAAGQSPVSQYKNNERWVIERNQDGSIKSLNVIRDARIR